MTDTQHSNLQRRQCPLRRHTAGGFTLIEVIMTIVILGIIATLGVSMLTSSIRAYVEGRNLTDLDWQGRVAIERMTRELRGVRPPADLNITVAGQVRFVDMNGNAVCFYLTGTSLMRSNDFAGACGTTNAQVLADRTSALVFTYLQNNGVTVALTPATVYYISVNAQFAAIQGTGSATYRATVHPRGF